MAVPSTEQESLGEREGRTDSCTNAMVSMHCTRPERRVFVEKNNADGWISTDFTVDLER